MFLIVCYIPPNKKQRKNPTTQVIVGKTKAQRQAEPRAKSLKLRCVSLPEEPTHTTDPRATHSEPIRSADGLVSFLIIVIIGIYLEARFDCYFVFLFFRYYNFRL